MFFLTKADYKRSRRSKRGSAIAEFAPTLFILLLITFFPLLNMMGLAIGAATVVLMTNDAAANAATQPSFDTSLSAMYTAVSRTLVSGFASFARVKPIGGFQLCGVDLYVQSTNLASKATTLSSANQSVQPPVDTTNNIYELAAISDFDVGPLIDMSGVPLLSSVPGIGVPARVVFRATRLVEHPDGLASTTTSTGNSTPLSPFARQPATTITSTTGTATGGWRNPTIYQQIAAAGQTVVTENVVYVPNNVSWVNSGLSIASGQQVWIDTNAVGEWVTLSGVSTDAIGYTQPNGSMYFRLSTTLPYYGCLAGCVGTPPPLGGNQYPTVPTYPQIFYVGDTLTNYQLQGTGVLSFMFDCDIAPGSTYGGEQLVRIIVTK